MWTVRAILRMLNPHALMLMIRSTSNDLLRPTIAHSMWTSMRWLRRIALVMQLIAHWTFFMFPPSLAGVTFLLM